MVIVWTPEWDNKLLVAIWETCGSKFDWETTAEIMGGTCTPEAIMQHLRTMTRKAADRRHEQRQILLESHAARAASVAKGKAKRKWGYNRSALKRIEDIHKGYESDASANSKPRGARERRSKRSPSRDTASADEVPATKDDRRPQARQKSPSKKKQPANDWYSTDTAEEASKVRVEAESRGKSRRRGTFWNSYDDEEEA